MEDFFVFLDSLFAIDSYCREEFLSMSKMQTFRESTILLTPNQIQENIFFIQDGTMRLYTELNGVLKTTRLLGRSEFALSTLGFLENSVSNEYLEVCSTTVAVSIKKASCKELILRHPRCARLFELFDHSYRQSVSEHHIFFQIESHYQRYKRFALKYPYLDSNMPSKYIENYLGLKRGAIPGFYRQMNQERFLS